MKRTLIISSWAPPQRRGAPIMMGNFLRRFPKESYVVLTSGSGYESFKSDDDWLPVKYYFFDPIPTKKSLLETTNVSSGASLKKIFSPILTPLLEISRIFSKGIEVIHKEKPTFLLGTSTGSPLIVTYLLHLITRKPYFIWLFDLYADNLLIGTHKFLANFFEGLILQNAKKVIVTNEATRSFYFRKYKIMAAVIPNSIDALVSHTRQIKKKGDVTTVIFTGSIYWAQDEGLRSLIAVINRTPRYQLLIYTTQSLLDLHRIGIYSNRKILVQSASSKEAQLALKKADIAFLPLSFHTKAPNIIKTATPGKLAEYLISRTPILVNAPRNSFIAKYARKKDFALVIDTLGEVALSKGIRKLSTDKKLRARLVYNAQKTFWQDYDLQKNSKKLIKILMPEND